MSRVAKKIIPLGAAQVAMQAEQVTVKGAKGELQITIHPLVEVNHGETQLQVKPRLDSKRSIELAGTMRSLLANSVVGVTTGFSKKLLLVGVGYRAQMQGSKTLILNLGYSHPVQYVLPEGITAVISESQTEIIISGPDKQRVGQVAAEVRAHRPVERYKGKGVRYENEQVILKETKKK